MEPINIVSRETFVFASELLVFAAGYSGRILGLHDHALGSVRFSFLGALVLLGGREAAQRAKRNQTKDTHTLRYGLPQDRFPEPFMEQQKRIKKREGLARYARNLL